MKTAILLIGDIKQIMFTPETDSEKNALKLITPDDNISTVIVRGTFASQHDEPYVFGASVYECQGGYYRAEKQEDSVMFVLTPKNKEKPNK